MDIDNLSRPASRLSKLNTDMQASQPSVSTPATEAMADISAAGDRITQLAEKISLSTAVIRRYLQQHQLPFPSFEEDAPQEFPKELESVRLEVFEATQELGQLMLGAKETLYMKATDNIASLHALSSYNLAQAVPLNGEASFAAISEYSGLNEPDVRRVVRHLASDRIFKEHRKGYVSHTAASRMIVQAPDVRDFLEIYFGEIYPAISKTVDALRKWPNSQNASHNGFALFSGGDTLFSYFDKHPEKARKFATSMSTFSNGPGWELEHALQAFDWNTISGGTVVDIGGSVGTVMAMLSEHYPEIRYIVQDLPSTIEKCPSQHPDRRISFMAHDFFTEQPVKGADVYFFRMILHNWSDGDSIRILRALIPALKTGVRIVLMEWCLPEPNTLAWLEEKKLRQMDMNMLTLFNSRERDSDDWHRLFRDSDPRFNLESISKPPGSNLSAINVVWRPEK